MQVERYQPRKKTNPLLIACGCLFGGILFLGAAVVVGLLLFAPQIQSFVMEAAGFEDIGTVDTVLSATAVPVPVLENPQNPENVVLESGSYSQTLDTGGTGYEVVVGENNENTELQISFDEAGLLAQCQQLTPICSNENTQISNAHFDLKPNAVIIRGQFQGIPQEAGLVFLVQNDNQLSVLGLEVGGSIFAVTDPSLNAMIDDASLQMNSLLQNLTAQAGGDSYSLSSIIADENTLTLIMR
jgi:hypothetical protein